jgi:hypothetical protein
MTVFQVVCRREVTTSRFLPPPAKKVAKVATAWTMYDLCRPYSQMLSAKYFFTEDTRDMT